MADFDCVICGACGCRFGIDAHRLATLRRTGETFYCPNGHARAYPKEPTPEQIRIRELENENAQLSRWLKRAQEDGALYKCPVAYCARRFAGKPLLRGHLVNDHRWTQETKALPENAGPNAYGRS